MTDRDISISEQDIASLPDGIRQQMREKAVALLNDLNVPVFTNPATGEISAPLDKVAEALGIPINEATEMLFGRAN